MIRVGGEADWTSIEELFERLFGDRSYSGHFPLLKKTENERAEVKGFIERAFRLMAISRAVPENISPSLAWILSVMIPSVLPGAWGNVVPPITYEDRHQLINQYLVANPWAEFADGSVLLEMGCGFPPQTAIDAARAFPRWQVVGADLRFDPYVLYDPDGNYACMDSAGGVRYFQPGPSNRSIVPFALQGPGWDVPAGSASCLPSFAKNYRLPKATNAQPPNRMAHAS